jgi:hypothetical protein
MAKRNEARREEMRRLIAEQEGSGISAVRFARERGMSVWTLNNWKRRLGAESVAVLARQRFVEVKVAQGVVREAVLSVELATGLRVQVPRDFEEEHLRRVIAVLSSC